MDIVDALMNHSEYHFGTCSRTYGPRGGIQENVQRARRNGATRTWKTRPGEFRLPIKIGFRGHGYITHTNGADWHVAESCPLNAPCLMTFHHECFGGALHEVKA